MTASECESDLKLTTDTPYLTPYLARDKVFIVRIL